MEEKLISHATAVLAKAKGFDWPTVRAYDTSQDGEEALWIRRASNWNTDVKDAEGELFSAPTQAFLAQWLREKRIDITVITDWGETGRTYGVGLSYVNKQNEVDIWFCKVPKTSFMSGLTKKFDTHEEAMEVGLQKALTFL
jgi:hypothetical protein